MIIASIAKYLLLFNALVKGILNSLEVGFACKRSAADAV